MISIKHITKIFNKGKPNEVMALENVSLQINKGEFAVIIGVNGSGKTTLLNIVGGAEIPTDGSIQINGTDVTAFQEYKRSRWVSRVFQNPNNGTAPELTILDNFRLAAIRSQRKKITIGINDSFKKKVRERIASLDMGLENKIYQPIGSLSGGQRQALTLLMSAMDNTNVLLLDEPTAALDPKSSQVVLNLAARLNIDDGITVILVTHNLKDATQNGNRLIQMHQGKILRDLNARAKDELLLQDIYKWFD